MPEAENSKTKKSPAADSRSARWVLGFILFPVAIFPFLSLVSYRWQSIPALCIPPETSTNLFGTAGDAFAYHAYTLIGLAAWTVPPLAVLLGLLIVLRRSLRMGSRFCFLALFLFAATCLLQLIGDSPAIASVLESLNLGGNAGGALGYLVMDCALTRLVSPFGASMLMATLMVFSLVSMIGFRAIVASIGGFVGGKSLSPEEIAEREQRKKEERERIDAAKAAAKAAKEAEKQRIAEERAAIKAAREAEKQRIAEERAAAKQTYSKQPLPIESFASATPQPAPAPAAPNVRAPSVPAPAPVSQPAAQSSATDQAWDGEEEDKGPYVLPGLDLLNPPSKSMADHGDVKEIGETLIRTLAQFNVSADLAGMVQGPVVTQYKITLAPGIKPERVESLQSTLMMSMKAKSLRIQAPIPGEDAVGIEMPNKTAASVSFREIIESNAWKKSVALDRRGQAKYNLPLLLGKDAAGEDLVSDLASMPHLLVAGATGQGKSVCLNSIINGLLMCRTPEQLKFIMIDPKCVEFSSYHRLPHLLVPVVTDPNKALSSLRWAVSEMEKRLKMFSKVGKRNIVDFNTREILVQTDMFGGAETAGSDMPRTVPYIVIIIDEVADLMQSVGKDVEPEIARLTAKARATGIHVILATQRPDTKVITGTIKSNIPGRIAFKTSSSIDSRTILDATGAESLIGRGDMLFRTKESVLIRAQGAWVSDEEIARITSFIEEHSSLQFDKTFASKLEKVKEAVAKDPFASDEDESDNENQKPGAAAPAMATTGNEDEDLYNQALEIVRMTKRASGSFIQRKLRIGFNHAIRLVEMMEDRGIVGPTRPGGSREILVDLDAMAAEKEAETFTESLPVLDGAAEIPADEETLAPMPEESVPAGDGEDNQF